MSTHVLMHGGFICVAFCLSVCLSLDTNSGDEKIIHIFETMVAVNYEIQNYTTVITIAILE